jgi:hypothetical protein
MSLIHLYKVAPTPDIHDEADRLSYDQMNFPFPDGPVR